MRDITCPVLNIYTETDHIIPPEMSKALNGRVGSEDFTEVVLKGGHIGIFVSARSLEPAQPQRSSTGWRSGECRIDRAEGASMDVMYTAEATSSGGREGRVRTADGVVDLPLSMPKELGGSGTARHHQPRGAVRRRLRRLLRERDPARGSRAQAPARPGRR